MKTLLLILLIIPFNLFAQCDTEAADKLLKAKEPNAARKLYSKILKKEPTCYKALMGRANAYYDLQDYTPSLIDYTNAIKIKDNDPMAYALRGGVYFVIKNYEMAIADFTKMIELDEKHSAYGYFMRGLSKSVLPVEDVSGACADFKRAKELGWVMDVKGLNEYCNATDLED